MFRSINAFSLLTCTTVVMILRVHAMWSRSRIILVILLFVYVPTIAVSIVWEGIYSNPGKTLSGMFRAQSDIPMQS